MKHICSRDFGEQREVSKERIVEYEPDMRLIIEAYAGDQSHCFGINSVANTQEPRLAT